MAKRLGVDLEALAGTAVVRRVEQNCALCGELDECGDWLRSGARKGNEEFCPNTALFDELRNKP